MKGMEDHDNLLKDYLQEEKRDVQNVINRGEKLLSFKK